MIREVSPSDPSLAAQIHAVSQAAYLLEAELICCSDFPPLHEQLGDLQRSSDQFLVFEQRGRIIGALSFTCAGSQVTITRVVISPAHLRQGIATALLAELERRLAPASILSVMTAQANTPAIRLYQQLGYEQDALSTSLEGIPLIQLSKSLQNS